MQISSKTKAGIKLFSLMPALPKVKARLRLTCLT